VLSITVLVSRATAQYRQPSSQCHHEYTDERADVKQAAIRWWHRERGRVQGDKCDAKQNRWDSPSNPKPGLSTLEAYPQIVAAAATGAIAGEDQVGFVGGDAQITLPPGCVDCAAQSDRFLSSSVPSGEKAGSASA
jgi:hypothetical protein